MKVIVCGAGQVGFQIARHLSQEDNDVTVIDQKADLLRSVTDGLDVGGVAGYASHPEVLGQAGADDADMLIAATHSDEVNMVACQVGHSVFSIPQKIARVRAQSYLEPRWSDLFRRDHMPIDVIISPEVEVARVVLRRIASPAAFESQTFLEGRVRVVGAHLDETCPVVNTPLRQLTELFNTLPAIVLAAVRDGKIHVMTADDQLFVGDDVYFIAPEEDVFRTLELFGRETSATSRAIIVGGGNIGLAVARELEAMRSGVRVKLIERDRRRAEIAADALERTIVLNGDGLDTELLREANVEDADAIVALTDDDKANLLAGSLGKRLGAKRSLALSNDATLSILAEPLGIDTYINPRATTVSTILRHVRRGRVRAVYSIQDGEAEVIEAQVLGTSPIVGKRIRDAGFPAGSLVGSVFSGGKVIRPTGDLVIREGDLVVVFAQREVVRKVERLFRVSVDFF
jgi:trk system potassium uptake protein TrkA